MLLTGSFRASSFETGAEAISKTLPLEHLHVLDYPYFRACSNVIVSSTHRRPAPPYEPPSQLSTTPCPIHVSPAWMSESCYTKDKARRCVYCRHRRLRVANLIPSDGRPCILENHHFDSPQSVD